MESAGDWKVQFDVNDEVVSVKERPLPSEIAVVFGPGSPPEGAISSMETNTVIWIELTSPWEDDLTKKHFEQLGKYNKLDRKGTLLLPVPQPPMLLVPLPPQLPLPISIQPSS